MRMVRGNIVFQRFPDHHYITIFNSETGLFIRLEEPGYNLPSWSPKGPELLDISITSWCDRECPRCYRKGSTSGKHMPVEQFRKIMEQAHDLPVIQVALGGGNPNQHPDFCEILRIARKEYGIVPSYTTNGRGLTEEVLEASLKYCGAVAVSAYRPYSELEHAIERLTSQGIKTNVHFVLDKKSIHDAITWLKKPPELLREVNALIFLNYKPVGRFDANSVLLKESDLLEEFFNLVQKSYPFKVGFDSCLVSGIVKYTSIPQVFYDGCDAGKFSMFISEDLLAYPCSFMVNNDSGISLHENNLSEIWLNGSIFQKIRSNELSKNCKNCLKSSICLGGCPIWDSINLCI